MKLLNRLGLLLRADAHGVVDCLESRALLLKQALRDAEDALERKRRRLESLATETKVLEARRAQLVSNAADLDADITLGMKEGKDDLARFAIRKLLPLRRDLKAVEARLTELAREQTDLAATVQGQERELEEMRTQVQAALAACERDQGAAPGPRPAAAEEEVEMELLRRRQVVTAKAGA